MTRRSGHSRPFPVLLLAGTLLSVAWLLAQTFDSASLDKWFDRDIYQDHQVHKVISLEELVEDFEAQQARWLPMAPPATNFIGWTQASTPDPMLFNPASFPRDFVKQLVGINRDGVVIYPVWASEDPDTRQRVFHNANGDILATVPAPADYDPRWCLVDTWLDPRWGSEYTEWLAQVYDPSHLVVRYDLILEDDLVKWLMARSIRAETVKAKKKDDPLDGGIILMRSLEAETSISIDGFVKTTSGNRLEIGYPDDFTNRLEIFACTNLIDFQWILAATNLSTLGTNTIYWTDTSTNYPIRFLAVGNAEADTDDDGLADGREKYLYHTSATNQDSDGDGLVDGYSGIVATNVYPGGATTNGLYVEGELTWGTDPNAFDTDQDGVGDGWEVANGHEPLDPNDPPNLLGTVYYAGRQTGTIHVVAVTSSNSWATNYSCTLTDTGAFHIVNLPGTSYWLKAWLDTDGSSAPNGPEATAQYTNNPVTITNQVTGRNLVLVDADTDSDGVPDWWEIEWFGSVTNWSETGDPDADNYTNQEEYQADTDPTDSSSHPWNLSGTITYTGAQTGLIHVAAYPSSISWMPVRSTTNATPGTYTITHLPPDTNYWVRAWRDTDGDGLPTSWEAWGQYDDNPVFLDENAAGISFTLTDPDTDGDGMPDYWELEYGLDPDTGWYTDLDGWWTLNESSGTNVADSSGNTNSGVVCGSAYGVGSIGVLSNALAFNGSNTYVQLTDAASLKPEYVSVSLWFKPNRDYTNGTAVFLSKKHPTQAYGYRLSYENGYLSFLVCATGAKTVKTLQTLTNGVWYHLVGAYGGTTQRLYVNGIQRATTNYTWGTGMGAIDQGTTAPRMGASTDTTPAYYFDGMLDDVRIYGAELASNSVMGIAEVGADSDQDGLSNIDEFYAGTDPTSADHLFEPIPYRGWDTNDSSIVTSRTESVSFYPHWDRFYLSSSASSARGWISTGVVFEVNGVDYQIPRSNSIDITANVTTSTTFRIKHIGGSPVVGLNTWVYLLRWHGEVTLEPEAGTNGLWIASPGAPLGGADPDRIYTATLKSQPPYKGGFTNRLFLSCSEASIQQVLTNGYGSHVAFTTNHMTTNLWVAGRTPSPSVGGSVIEGKTQGSYLLTAQTVTVFAVVDFLPPASWSWIRYGLPPEYEWGSNVTVMLEPTDVPAGVLTVYNEEMGHDTVEIGSMPSCPGGTNVVPVTWNPLDGMEHFRACWAVGGVTSWMGSASVHWTVNLAMLGNTIDDQVGGGRFYRLVDSPQNTHVWLTGTNMTNVTWTISPELPDGARLATWDTGPGSFVSLSGVREVWISAGSTARVYSIEVSCNDVPQWSTGAQFVAVDVRYGKFDHVCRGDCLAPLHDLPTEILPTDCGAPIGLELWKPTGGSGDAVFVTNSQATLTITQDVVLAIQGTNASSFHGNLEAKASLGLETATTRVFTVVEAVDLTVTEDPVHPGNSVTDDSWTNGTPVFLICEETNQTARMRIDFLFMPPDDPSTNVTAYWETNTYWVLGHDIGGVLFPSTNWSLAQGDGRTTQVDTVWEYAAGREYSLWIWMDCNTNSGSFDPEETHRKVDIKVVNTTALTLDDVDSSRVATDTTWVDEGPNATNTLLLSEDTNGTARMDVNLGWVPGVSGEHFRVEITAEGVGEFGFSTNRFIPTNQPYRVEWTNAVDEVEACRMYSVRGWFDCNGNGAYDDGEPCRKVYVAVPSPELLTLTDPVTSISRYDTTWSDEVQSVSNTLYLVESTDGTAQMQIGLEWLPTTANSNWFRWEIRQTNGGTTAQWSCTNGAAFTTNPVTVTWTNQVGGESNRVFVVNGWFDANGNGSMNEAEPHRQLFMIVLKVELTNIKFNHDTGSSASDAINIRQDYTTPIDISNGEWVKGGANIPACYTTNKAVTIKARFTVQPASITNADIWAISTDAGGSLGDVIKTNVTFSGGVSSPEYVTFQVSGTTPNCIQKTTNDVWQWKMENVNGSGSPAWDLNTSGVHTVYTILNEPTTPWINTAANALNVWTRILDKSCLWANGCVAGSTVLSNIVTQTYGMGVVYDGAQHYTYPGYTQFHLQSLLDDLDAAGTDNMDCRDFANWTHTLSGSVGVGAQYRVVDRTTYPYYFTYNYILPSGHANWNTDNWNFHQVGWWNSRVCDASLKLDNDSDPTQGPGNSNHIEKLSVGDMTQADYLDKLTETPDVTDIETGTCVLQ